MRGPALYSYIETVAKSFVTPDGVKTVRLENIFQNEPIRRFALAMNTNRAFSRARRGNPFNYQKFNLISINVSRNGQSTVGTPMDTTDNKLAYYNTLDALAFYNDSHGIPLEQFEHHYVLVFDLTSTGEAAHDLLYPELSNESISLNLHFSVALPESLEIFLLDERASVVSIDSARTVTKNTVEKNG